MPSITLSNAGDKTTIKKLLPSSSNKILTATVVRLYQAHPDPRNWSYTNTIGAIALVQDKSRGHKFFFRIVDLQENKGILWEHELGPNFIYKNDTPFFHTFGTKDYVVGLSFADDNEAATFYKKVLAREKNAKKSKKSSAPENDKSKSFFSSSSKNKTKGKIDKSLIGKPMDFKHLGHIGYDSNAGFSAHHEDPEWQRLFSQLGVDGSAQEQAFSDTKTMESLVSFVQKNGGIKQVNQNLQSGKLTGLQPQSSQSTPPKQKRPPPPPPPSGNKPRRGPPPPPNRASLTPTPAPGLPPRQPSPTTSPPPAPPRAVPAPPASKPPPLPSSQRPALPGQKPPLPSSRPPPLPSSQRPSLPGQKPPPTPQRSSPAFTPPVVATPPASNIPPPPPASISPPPPPPPPAPGGVPPPPPPPPAMGGAPPPPPPPAGGAPPPALPAVPDDRFSLLKSIQAGTTLRKVGAPEARDKVDAPPQPPASSGDGNLASALMSILENRRNDLESDEEDEDDDWDD